ncbi:hypothetical protein [Lysinibacter sp. HNR]|uniref:hypothetical protein n=1 Tax=Lysinibacter sp. HNR TaxID=3031408 RepID=UPI002435B2D5|nr:hypothetical protein [Lysinibacter sp. HNR]WGD37674.1 hypothetical protein FrondiHNR_01805 [Lysinibacter sp. HNR]
MARHNGLFLPVNSAEHLAEQYTFTELQSFLDLHYVTMSVLRPADDCAERTRRYLRAAAYQGLHHVELFFDPQVDTA